MRIIVAITGASGSVYGIELLRQLAAVEDVETHLVVSAAGYLTISSELGLKKSEVDGLADYRYSDKDIGAAIASGSFRTDGMIVSPCSMKTLGAIANGISTSLVSRAADVVLKERRRLVLVARETPLNLAHLRNMVSVAEMGGVIYPPVAAFYTQPDAVDVMIRQTVGRLMLLLGVDNDLVPEWTGLGGAADDR